MSGTLASASVDAVVVGAGVAGLSAAEALRRRGLSVAILEAGHRIGGRAWTDHPPALGGTMFDHGAQWLHSANQNPLVPIARAAGEPVHADLPWEQRLLVADGQGGATAPGYEAAEKRWRKAVTAELGGTDMSLADAAHAVADDPWTATIEFWEGAIIAAADADVLSLHDWSANELEGENFVAPGGLGAMLARVLAPQVTVHFGARVHAIEAEAGGVRVCSSIGTIRAAQVIVTVSTGVLAAGHICFLPALPAETQAAIDGLPMGLLTKIALHAAGPDRLGLESGTDMFRPLLARGASAVSAIFWPDDAPIVTGFIGGRNAWHFADAPDAAAAFLRDDITHMLGTRANKAFRTESLMTDWGTNPLFLGAYAYATPGQAGAREALARPIWDGRLTFAGEACAPAGFAGTVAGAHLSGVAAGKARGSAPILQAGTPLRASP